MIRDKVFQFRMSVAETQRLDYIATRRRITQSEVLRQLIFTAWNDERAIKDTENFHKKKALKKGVKNHDK